MTTIVRLREKPCAVKVRQRLFCNDIWGLIKQYMLEKKPAGYVLSSINAGTAFYVNKEIQSMDQSERLGAIFLETASNRDIFHKLSVLPEQRTTSEQVAWKRLATLLLGTDLHVNRSSPPELFLARINKKHWYRKNLIRFALRLTLPLLMFPDDQEDLLAFRGVLSSNGSEVENRVNQALGVIDNILNGKEPYICNDDNSGSLVENPLLLPYMYYIGDSVKILRLDRPARRYRMFPVSLSPLKFTPSLESLSLNNVLVSFDSFIEIVPLLTKLKHLNLENTGLTGGRFYRLLARLRTPKLQRLDFSSNFIGDIPPEGLGEVMKNIEGVALKYFSQLEEFYIPHCSLSFEAVCALSVLVIQKCPRMLHFHVSGNYGPAASIERKNTLRSLIPDVKYVKVAEGVYLH